ncbi:conserved Plasmodium protein, unknown function [Plasmodium malariae]|uniref:Ribosomal RNA-processing protein 14/surfeit locus protein 6 C-terminal domain-containing protein n=1 Tax=Plasmodium malariae TaxID=5858 RepID=A0A1C3KBV9_PLAMA|nr:conserved Plasmodium protein, unknown function [Plasmodium malariae]
MKWFANEKKTLHLFLLPFIYVHLNMHFINDSSDDLLLGNIPDLNEDTKKKMSIPKRIQIKKSFRLLKREKKLLDNLDSEKKEKVEHLLRVRKAVLKSKGEKVYDEKSLKKRRKNLSMKKEKSRKRWENKKKKKN